jgi:hypothetical protein
LCLVGATLLLLGTGTLSVRRGKVRSAPPQPHGGVDSMADRNTPDGRVHM